MYIRDCKVYNYNEPSKIREHVQNLWSEARDSMYARIREGSYYKKNRLRKCSAYVYIIDCDTVVLMSYDTIIAIKTGKSLYKFGRYSSTSYQHERKFEQDYCEDVTKVVNLCIDDWYK